MRQRIENGVAIISFGAVRTENVYTLLFERGIHSDGVQSVEVYDIRTLRSYISTADVRD